MGILLLLFALTQANSSDKFNSSLIETKWPLSCPGERKEHVCLADNDHCSGVPVSGFCEFPEFCCFRGTDAPCKAKGACCQRKEYCTLKSVMEYEPRKPHNGIFTFYAGLCPASEVLQCCKEGGPGGEICYDQIDDKCIDVNATCHGVSVQSSRLCPKESTACCLTDPEDLARTCVQIGGQCTTTEQCHSVPGSKLLSGKCPGTDLITCCIHPSSTPQPYSATSPPNIPPPHHHKVATPISYSPHSSPPPPISSTKAPPAYHPSPWTYGSHTPKSQIPINRDSWPKDSYSGVQEDFDRDDCISCRYLFDQLRKQQVYLSREWYYATLAHWCGVDGAVYGLGSLQGVLPRASVLHNLYPTCIKLFGGNSILIDDAITQALAGSRSDEICENLRLCLLSPELFQQGQNPKLDSLSDNIQKAKKL